MLFYRKTEFRVTNIQKVTEAGKLAVQAKNMARKILVVPGIYYLGFLPTNSLSVFDHLVGLELKGLKIHITLTHYTRCCLSTPLENIKKHLVFLMFSGGIDKQHRL